MVVDIDLRTGMKVERLIKWRGPNEGSFILWKRRDTMLGGTEVWRWMM